MCVLMLLIVLRAYYLSDIILIGAFVIRSGVAVGSVSKCPV